MFENLLLVLLIIIYLFLYTTLFILKIKFISVLFISAKITPKQFFNLDFSLMTEGSLLTLIGLTKTFYRLFLSCK